MRILAIDKYEEPVVKEIENNLKDMQRYVLGHIETITLSETAMLVCNDVGKLANLTPNRILKIGRIIYGCCNGGYAKMFSGRKKTYRREWCLDD